MRVGPARGARRSTEIIRFSGVPGLQGVFHTLTPPFCPAAQPQSCRQRQPGTTAAAPEPGLCRSLGSAGWQRGSGSAGRAQGRGGLATPPGSGGSGCPDATSQRSSLQDLSRQRRACCALISPLLPAAELVPLSLPPHSRRGFSPHLIRVCSPPGAPYVPPTRVAGAAQALAPDGCLGESCLHKIVFPFPSPGICFIPRPERPVPPAPPQARPARI